MNSHITFDEKEFFYPSLYDKEPTWIKYVGYEKTDQPNVFRVLFQFDEWKQSDEIRYSAIVHFNVASKSYQTRAGTGLSATAEVTPKADWHIGCEGATFTIHLDLKHTLETPIIQPNAPWITFYDQNIEKNVRDVMVVVKPNPNPESRVYNYAVTWNNVSITMSFLQDGTAASFVRSGTEVFAGNWEQTIPIELGTSDYTVEISGNPSWLIVGEKKEDAVGCTQEFVVKANTTGQNRNAKITFRSGSKVQEVNFTQFTHLDLPKIEVDAAWKNYPISSLEYNVYSNSTGTYLFNALVPDPIDFIDTMYRKVLSELYLSHTDANIPVLPQTYVFEIKENETGWGGSKNRKMISVAVQNLEKWYKEGGTEKMMKELQNHFISAMVSQFMIENPAMDTFTLRNAIKLLESTEETPSRIANSNYYDQSAATYFFRWLTLNKDRDFLRKLNASSLYVKPWSLERAFKYALGKQYDIDELWDEFVKTIK